MDTGVCTCTQWQMECVHVRIAYTYTPPQLVVGPSVSDKGLQQLIRFAGPFFYQVPTRSPTPTLEAIALIEIGLVELRDLGVHVTPFSWSLVTPEDGSGRLVCSCADRANCLTCHSSCCRRATKAPDLVDRVQEDHRGRSLWP